MIIEEIEKQFWEQVADPDENGCMLWIGAGSGAGSTYGIAWLKPTRAMTVRGWAHRISWELFNEQSIPDNLVVMHSCDVKLCVSPFHLTVGTQAQNIQDALFKGLRNTTLGYKQSIATRQKIGDALRGCKRPLRSDIWKQNLGNSLKGRVAWNSGKKNIYSQETLQKMRKGSLGNKNALGAVRSEETLSKLSVLMTPERLEKMQFARWNGKVGLTHPSDETRLKMSESHRKRGQ